MTKGPSSGAASKLERLSGQSAVAEQATSFSSLSINRDSHLQSLETGLDSKAPANEPNHINRFNVGNEETISVPKEMTQFSTAIAKLRVELDRAVKTDPQLGPIRNKLYSSYDQFRDLRNIYGADSDLHSAKFAEQLNKVFDAAKEARIKIDALKKNPLGISPDIAGKSFTFEVEKGKPVAFHWDHYDMQTRSFGLGDLGKGIAGYKPFGTGLSTMDVPECFHVTRRFDPSRNRETYTIEPYDSFKGRVQIRAGKSNGHVYLSSVANSHLDAPSDSQVLGVDRNKLLSSALDYWNARSLSRRTNLPNDASLEPGTSLTFSVDSTQTFTILNASGDRLVVQPNNESRAQGFPLVRRQGDIVEIVDNGQAAEGQYKISLMSDRKANRAGSFSLIRDKITAAPDFSENWLVEGSEVSLKIHPQRSMRIVVGGGTSNQQSIELKPNQSYQGKDLMNVIRESNGIVKFLFPGTAREGRYDVFLDKQTEPFTRVMAVSAVTDKFLAENRN